MIKVNLKEKSYDIVLEHGALDKIEAYLDLNRKVMIITDDGVPCEYSEAVAKKCRYPVIKTVKTGEKSKSLAVAEEILKLMLENNFSRKDCVVAVGGGVVGDLSGFVASIYMRGIDFYNIPTTVLSQVDSSVGGKVAVNMDSVKNIIGSFYQPKKVVIDPDTLKTLPKRQINNGLVESVKMAATNNEALFDFFENEDIYKNLDYIIKESLLIKKSVVEADEKENNYRKILNFGHTVGHGIEAYGKGKLFHGEAVALGTLFMCSESVRERLLKIYKKLDMPIDFSFSTDEAFEYIKHDKKGVSDNCDIVYVDKIGRGEIKTVTFSEIYDIIKNKNKFNR